MSAYKKQLCSALLLLTLFTVLAHGNPADDEKPFIFINTAADLGNVLSTKTGMVRFAEIARAKGFEIDHDTQYSLDDAALEGVDIYVFIDTHMQFLDEDRIALRQWVRAGGILIIGDWTAPAPADGFMTEFGVELMPVQISRSSELSLTPDSPLGGPLKLSRMKTEGYRPLKILDPSKAEAILLYEDGRPAMIRSISHAGAGTIITIGCPRVFFNDFSFGTGDIKLFDNEKLVLNFFEYLRDLSGLNEAYDLKMLKVKARGGGNFVPGDKIKLVAKLRNVGSLESEATSVAFYLEKSGSAPSARIKVAMAAVPSIKANKRKKIISRTTLPKNIDTGSFNVIAVVDPNNITDDGNTGNNSSTAKKKIIIE